MDCRDEGVGGGVGYRDGREGDILRYMVEGLWFGGRGVSWWDLKGGGGGKIWHGSEGVDNTSAPTNLRAAATLRHHPCPCVRVLQISPISSAGPEIPLSSYPPAAPPAPFPVDPKAGPTPPQPGFTPMAMYPPPGPAAQYPMYPSGPPVYNPTGEHRGGRGTLAILLGAWWRGDTPFAPPAAPPPYVPAQPSYPGA